MLISRLNNIYRNQVNEKDFAASAVEKTEKEEDKLLTENEDEGDQSQREDSLEISPEGRLAVEQQNEVQKADSPGIGENEKESTSEEQSGKVAVNEGKRIRQIMAAQSRAQIQQVLSLLQKDLSDCKAGLEKGWCDESEIAKVEALINKANARMSQVPENAEQEQGGLDEFAMASLM